VPDIWRAVAWGVPADIVTNLAVMGGINRAFRFLGACEAMGVGLDRDALNHRHQHFVDKGPMDHFYDPYRPGYFRRLSLS
jgi:hypothetical protein